MAETQKKSSRGAKKSFFEVGAPMTSTKISLYASSIEELDGRVVLLDLTKILRGKSFELRLKVILRDGKLESEAVGLQLAGSYIRRMMRRGADYVEDSFTARSRDNPVRIKPFMITRHKVSREVRKKIREEAKATLEAYVKSRTSAELFSEIISSKLQKMLSMRLRKVYPLALCEIRTFEIEGEKKSLLGERKAEEKKETKNEEKKE